MTGAGGGPERSAPGTASIPVRGVLLDFGGVLWNMRWDVARELEGAHGLPARALLETLYRTPAWEAVERGRGETGGWRREAHALLEARAGRALPPLHDAWLRAQHPVPASVAVTRALRPRYRVGLLSNADISLRARLADGLGILDLFDAIVASAEEGLAKPEPAIYRLAAERLGLPPSACVFVDDYDVNVAAAVAVGMRGIHLVLDRGDDLAARLAEVGVVA